MKVVRIGVTAMALCLAAWPAAAELPRYLIKNLGTLIPSTSGDGFLGYSEPRALNSNGQVVGFSFAQAGLQHAFVHDGEVMRDLGIYAGGAASYAMAINDLGLIAGTLEQGANATRGFVHDGTTLWELAALGGSNSSASGINNFGVIVGSASIAGDATTRAVAYLSYQNGGARQELGTLGGTNSVATAVSDDGGIVGFSDVKGDAAQHAFLVYFGTHDLGTLGGTNSKATAINVSGAVVGVSEVSGNTAKHAFKFDGLFANLPMRDLGTLGGANSMARGINATGHVVGESDVASGSLHAFLHDGTTMHDLNSLVNARLGFELWTAAAINDSGQIAVLARYLGEYRAVLLTRISSAFEKLLGSVVALGSDKKLIRVLFLAQTYYSAQNLSGVCASLDDFAAQVAKLPRKKISQTQRADLTSQSKSIELGIGCS